MGPEARLKRKASSYVRQLGGVYLPLGALIAGTPDALIVFQGRVYLVEFKAGRNSLTRAQAALHAKIGAAGVKVHVIYDIRDLKEVLHGETTAMAEAG